MNENKKNPSFPEGIRSIIDDEAITEIDLGDFLTHNSDSSSLFDGFRDDIEKTEKSLESDLQSLYDDILGSGPETIVPKPLSTLTESEAEPKKVVLSDPEPLPDDENSTLDDLWMNPDDYFDADIPVVSLDEEESAQEAQIFEPAPENAENSDIDEAKSSIFSMIDMLKKETDAETGFDDILSEIESNPEIVPVDSELSSAAKLVSDLAAEKAEPEEEEEELDLNEEDFDWEELLGEEEAEFDVSEELPEAPAIPDEPEKTPEPEAEAVPEADDLADFEDLLGGDDIPAPAAVIPVPEVIPEADDLSDFEDLFGDDEISAPEENSDSEDFSDEDLDALLGETVPETAEAPEIQQKKNFVINVPDDGNDYEKAAAAPEKLYQSAPMSTATLDDDPDLFDDDYEPEEEERKSRKSRRKNKKEKDEFSDDEPKSGGIGEIVRKIVLSISIITIIVCIGMLANVYIIEPYRFKADSDKIASEMSENINAHSDATVDDVQNTPEVDYPEGMLAKYASLYAANDDLRGWVSIPGFEINLPVAQGKDNSYYLKKDIYGKYTRYGVPFFDFRIDNFTTLHRNTVIYGHNMRHDDLIFGMLENYREISGFRQAPVIECNTIYGDHTWFVYAVFITNAEEDDDNGYVFPYNFIDVGDAKFEAYIEEIDKRKLYTTGVDLAVTDKILTLSTCAYDFNDARLVVVARERREGESIAIDTSKAYKNDDPKFPQAYYDAYGKTNTHANDSRW